MKEPINTEIWEDSDGEIWFCDAPPKSRKIDVVILEKKDFSQLERDLAVAKEALESVGGLDCVRWNKNRLSDPKPCGVCFSCEARNALARLSERKGKG